MDTQPPKGLMPKPEMSSVDVSGMVMIFQPSSCLNSLSTRLMSVVLPAAGPPVSTIRVICFAKGTAPLLFYSIILTSSGSKCKKKAQPLP